MYVQGYFGLGPFVLPALCCLFPGVDGAVTRPGRGGTSGRESCPFRPEEPREVSKDRGKAEGLFPASSALGRDLRGGPHLTAAIGQGCRDHSDSTPGPHAGG